MVTCSSLRRHVTSVKHSLEPSLSCSLRVVRHSPTSALWLPPEDPSLCCRHIVFSSIRCKATRAPRHVWRTRNFLHRAALTWRHLLANLCTCSHYASYQDISVSCGASDRGVAARCKCQLSVSSFQTADCLPAALHLCTPLPPLPFASTLCPVAAGSPTS